MNNKLYEKAFELRRQKEQIEKEEEENNKLIMAELQSLEARKYSNHFGTWSVATKAVWTYSDAVKNAKEAAKRLEKEEQENGLAVKEETSYLRFQSAKIHESNNKA